MKSVKIVIVICIIFFLCACSGQNHKQVSSATANKSREAYEYVIQQPMSTSPYYVVATVKDMNTGTEKEMCMEIGSLYWLCSKIIGEDGDEYDYMQQNAETRVFEVKDKDVLSEIGFYDYKLNNREEIEKILVSDNILDSIVYAIQFANSIEEGYIMEEVGDEIIIKEAFDNSALYTEYYRLKSKFVEPYIIKYGLNFCHVLFDYGVIFRRGCLDGRIEFSREIIE